MFSSLINKLFRNHPNQKKQFIQFIKYISGGNLYFWSGYAVFAIGYSVLHLWWLWAKVAADAVGWSLNYFVQRYWAFNSEHLKLNEMQHVKRYLFIETIGFILDYAIIGGLKYEGITPYIGFFISAGFFSVWSFLWYKYWVFPEGGIKIEQSK
jgi:putative flippase GtrA